MVQAFINALNALLLAFSARKPEPAPLPVIEPPVPIPEPSAPNPDVLLPWIFGKSLTHNNWHNVRVLCDLEGLSPEGKETLTATVWGESEFNTHAMLENKDKTGSVWSTDRGICQWNDYWHAKEITPHEAFNDPEKAVRLMCQYWKRGEGSRRSWVAYSSGAYKRHMGKKL